MMGAIVGRNCVMLHVMLQRGHGRGWRWSQRVLGRGPWAEVEDGVLVLEQAKESVSTVGGRSVCRERVARTMERANKDGGMASTV
jgi:hypothetical protein